MLSKHEARAREPESVEKCSGHIRDFCRPKFAGEPPPIERTLRQGPPGSSKVGSTGKDG